MFDLEGEYLYDAVKIENRFYAIALPKKINLKIDKKYIKSVRIAQTEFFDYECLEIDENFMLKKIGDILFITPKENHCPKIQDILKNIKLSNYKVNLDTINIDKSVLISLFLIFLFTVSYFIAGIINYKIEFEKLNQQKTNLLKYNLPLTSIQLDAIYSDLKNIDNKQNLIRKDLEFFSKTPLKKNERYIKLIYNKNYQVEINTSKNLDNFFSQRFNIVKSTFKNNLYKAELSHE